MQLSLFSNMFDCDLSLDSFPEEDDDAFRQENGQKSPSAGRKRPSQDSTYDTLHGVSTPSSSSQPIKESDDYDIFDDLC